ncbi:hypothetical protein ACFX2I_003143 [Malus domestica]
MKPHKLLNPQTLKPYKLRPTFPANHPPSAAPLSFVVHPTAPTTPLPPITHHTLLTSIHSSQWHFIEHLLPNIPPSLISDALFDLRKSPELVLEFISHVEFHRLDVDTRCLAIAIVAQPSPKRTLELLKQVVGSGNASVTEIFEALVLSRERLGVKSSLGFDLLAQTCCEMNRADDALECFYLMKGKGVLPNNLTCNDMLNMFLKMNRTDRAWVLYAEMFRLKIKSSVSTFNIMINVLCKEGKLKKAKEFVGFMETLGIQPNVVTYNTIIHGYCSIGRVGGAQMMFCAMKGKGVEPDSYTYGSLISGMCKERRLEEASGIFDKMLELGLVPTAVTYNTLIDGYCNKGDLDKAFGYRDEMVKKGILPTVSTYNMLIHALLMEGKMAEADDMVKEMKDKGLDLDAITYNILINGYCRSGDAKKAFSLRDEMLIKRVEPTKVTYTSLIYVLSRRKRMHEADDLFKKLLRKGVLPDLVMFNALIDGHCANGNMERAVALLEEMDKMKVHPDEVTYNTLMQGRCREGKVEEARQLMEEMKRRGIKPDHISFNTLISGYSKRGDLKDAFKVRDEMLSIGFNPTVLTYNALIQGLCKNQEGDLAEELLKEMIVFIDDLYTYFGAATSLIPVSFSILPGTVGSEKFNCPLYEWNSEDDHLPCTRLVARFWYPFNSPVSKLKHLELIFILSFSVWAILMQVIDFPLLQFSFKLHNLEHATMFLHLVIFAAFTLCAELIHSLDILSGVVGILVASVFCQELFLLHFHSADHVGLEGHYHWLLQLIVFASVMAALAATCFRTSLPAALVLSISVVFQGCWFMNMGFMLWVPRFVPKGCVVHFVEGTGDSMLGAVTCETSEADFRARALANLQFSWILSGILIFTGCTCLKFAGKCIPRELSIEYEQLQSRGADIPVAMNDFKEAYP